MGHKRRANRNRDRPRRSRRDGMAAKELAHGPSRESYEPDVDERSGPRTHSDRRAKNPRAIAYRREREKGSSLGRRKGATRSTPRPRDNSNGSFHSGSRNCGG